MNRKQLTAALILLVFIAPVWKTLMAQPPEKAKITVHAVADLSHEFTFYADNRFHTQYLKNQKGVTNWCSLFNFDFSNANLLILLGCANK